MKRFSIAAAVAASTFAVTATSPQVAAGTRIASTQVFQSQTRGPAAQAAVDDSRSFITKMAKAGSAELMLGKIAVERASDAEVKSFAQTLIDEHAAANQELLLLAEQFSVKLPAAPDEKDRALAKRLSSLRDSEFDREYLTAMVQAHTDALATLKGRATAAGGTPVGTSGGRNGDQGLAQWAAQTLSTVRKHLERAQELQQKVR